VKNLIYQYYIPYEANDADIGGVNMPDWAMAGSRSAKAYAKHCGADYLLVHDRFFKHLDPRLDSTRLYYDRQFEKYDKILCLDLDMLVNTKENIFDINIDDVAMVHELGVHDVNGTGGWMKRVMDVSLSERGIVEYGKHLFGPGWMFPRSKLYPKERFRYLNGGLQLWSKVGRLKAKDNFTSIDDYVLHTRYTEQMYINLQLSQPIFNVTELDTSWNRSMFQWRGKRPDGKINHFIARSKFDMPRIEIMGV
tara:strand:+ start:279 stop:1031 length:753 start_codon:yes stop_codon:yes gene_type:complete